MSAIPTSDTDPRRPRGSSLSSEWRELLQSRITALRTRVVRLLWLRAVAVLLILCLLGIAGAVALDWWLRPSGTFGRWGLGGMLVGWLVGVGVWFVRGIPRRRISTAVVARQLERRIPSLGDRLSSAVALIEPRKAEIAARGPLKSRIAESSISERRLFEGDLPGEVVRQAAEELQAVRPERTIDPMPTVRLALFAALLVGMGIAACLWRPATAELAARRLLAPSSAAAWPRRNHLELANVPERIHAGSDLEVFVRDLSGTLPADTEILVRDSDGNLSSPPLRMSGTAGAARLESIAEDFAIRASGGDDDTMPWQRVQVVAAPRITSYQMRLLPPEYSRREPRTLVGAQIRVLAGTQMWIKAEVEPPVVAATLERIDRERQSPAEGSVEDAELAAADRERQVEQPTWPVDVAAAGRRLTVGPIVLDREGLFVFRWTDREGLADESDERWRVEIEPDAVPRVAIIQPAEDREVTAGGSVELEIVAEDDLGLAESWFQVQASDRSLRFRPEQYAEAPRERTRKTRVPVEQLLRPEAADATDDLEAAVEADVETSDSESADLEAADLGVGQTIELIGVAIDIAGQRGESTTRRLRIVSLETLRQSLAEDQRSAIEPLRQAAREQTVAAEQTEAARGRLFGDSEQRRAAEDRLRAAEAAQAAAERRMAEGPNSVLERLRAAVRTAEDNGIDAEALKNLLAALETAAQESMQPAGERLARSRSQLMEDDEQAAARTMDEAIANQRQAAEALSQIISAMRRDDARRTAIEDLAELQAAHARLSQASRQIADAADTGAEASRLAQQQRQLARETEAMGERLQQLAKELSEQSPDVAAAAGQAAETLQQGGADSPQPSASVAEAMRSAAAELERGREGRAGELQAKAADQLSAAQRDLSGGNRVPQTAEAESEDPLQAFATGLETLRGEQSALVAALREQTDPALATTQETLAERGERLAATPTAPPGYAEAVSDAAGEMRVAAALLRRRGSESAAVDRAEAALTRLDFIAESLRGPADSPSEDSPQSDSAESTAEREEQGEANEPVPLATLRLVRATQEFLRVRTEQLAEEEQAAPPPSAGPAAEALRRARLQAAKRALAEEQQRLLERIERYAQEAAAARANEPEESDAPIAN